MEDRHHRGNAINPLEAEPQVNQHAQQRIKGGQSGLGAQLAAHLGTDNLEAADTKIRQKETIWERSHHARIDPRGGLQLVSGIQHPALDLLTIVDDGLWLLALFL